MQKSGTYKSFHFRTNLEEATPSFCPVCDFIISTSDDVISYSQNGCCNYCFASFVESRKDLWSKGWRPKKKDVEKIKAQRSVVNPKFRSI